MTDRRVLVVEDDADRAVLTRRALSQVATAPDVHVVEDGQAALDRLAEVSRPPDLVLLDLGLPGLHGFDVLDRLQDDELPDVPVVVLTSNDEHETVLESYERGAHGLVTKPVDYEEFRQAVDAIANFWLEVNLTPNEAA